MEKNLTYFVIFSIRYSFIYLALLEQVVNALGLSDYPATTVNGPIDLFLDNCNQNSKRLL
ncbi:hypothetical protein GFS03_07810 [Sulfolobus sp. E5-1-F]|uniref:hypothetical protein n=1 Tax=Sulfolobaceae TaxID=118883 RepID=UPI001296745C|nr:MULTISPECIES: hypothetical protein [unclassified Sulfolobus]QGA54479.1 hypothetical protein GFS03_07810 [Sulfolobus sp. E5-1-F]QGA69515.1 hypothetical protein GFS33_13235 [Sulfolobus sp. E11-6]